jgi:hypothetical protein
LARAQEAVYLNKGCSELCNKSNRLTTTAGAPNRR